jgi:hypothetical protein
MQVHKGFFRKKIKKYRLFVGSVAALVAGLFIVLVIILPCVV